MSDRKYRQRGYQDEPRQPRTEQRAPVKKEYTPRGQPPISPKTFSMPGFREVVRWPRAIPQYELGHGRFVERAREIERSLPGLRLAGNFLAGISVPDCIRNATALAEEMLGSRP